jgi:sigma-B regulation protein RsbU (phosphoserine phosphatase)
MSYGDDASSRELFFLYELAKVFASTIDLAEVTEYVLDGTCALLGAEQGFLYFLDSDDTLRAHEARGLEADHLRALAQSFRPAVENRQPLVAEHPYSEEGSAIAAPLITRNEVAGLVGVATAYARQFTPEEFERITAVANLASLALENARLYQVVQQELALGRKIQESFLPSSCPATPCSDLAAISRPARQVGGDFFDFIPLPKKRLGLVVADVSEKGVPAALFMALTRSLMRVYSGRGTAPGRAIHRVNEFLVADSGTSSMFVTLFYAIWDPERGSLHYANAGHNPPLIRRADGSLEIFPRGGLALGVLPGQKWTEGEVLMQPGDLLVAYSDGLTEAMNSTRELFGTERLYAFLRKPVVEDAQLILDQIIEEADRFTGDYPQFDDMTLLVLRFEESPEA